MVREDDEQFQHYVPLLRRVIILVAVIIAVPVVLWTITAFVHSYFGPPKLPTFRPLVTASTEKPAPAATAPQAASPPPSAIQHSNVAEPTSPASEARPATMDVHDSSAAGKGPLLDEHAADTSNASASPPQIAAMTLAVPTTVADSKATESPVAPSTAADAAASGAAPPAVQQTPVPAEPATADSSPALAAAPPAADTSPPAAPLSEPIPLPPRRPSQLAMAETGVPMPRPRPASADAGAPSPETTSSGPLDFLQNLFRQKSE